MKHQKGQALVESAIAMAFIIIPVLLLLPFLHKISEVKHRNTQAAQYAAWERTVWRVDRPREFPGGQFHYASKTEANLNAELPWRFYQQNGQAVRSNYTEEWSWQEKSHSLLKHTLSPDEPQSLLLKSASETPEDNKGADRLAASVSGRKAPGLWETSVGTARNLLSYTGFALDRNRFYVANVGTDLEKFRVFPLKGADGDPMEALDLKIESKSALLTHAWNAGGPAHAKRQTERLVLTKYADIKPVTLLQSVLGLIPFGREIKPNSLRFGHTDVEALPANRLCNYGSANCGDGGK
ncbi:hypothetical protein SHAM105786_07225 [Shewanella amazonensis]|uniref:TadE-like protein n=1 Tax=Shewanella amazonensis (strain ATCC BAA-1098 / SB2B) TaxID=326297 RepID=A1S3F5_SHEAM|nr:hypothetical protein [Shewanella amazonensis]ABL98911.1 hypothetical protein Sama_0703 [Shewanella amazonensis SB2B]